MNTFKIPHALNKLIFKILNNRLLYVRGNGSLLLGPTLATRGLPQGLPLSTLLFNNNKCFGSVWHGTQTC